MSAHFDRFLRESVTTDRDTDSGMDRDELYGLYTSWCLINRLEPEFPEHLWAALQGYRISPDENTLAMTGPAATDYILASAPDLV